MIFGNEPPKEVKKSEVKQTEVRIWRPTISGELNDELRVRSSESGNCSTSSGSNPSNPQALRCFGEIYVLDPLALLGGQSRVSLGWSVVEGGHRSHFAIPT